MTLSVDLITGYHAHVYYDDASKPRAQALRMALEAEFSQAEFGRWHDAPVGPHPDWSFQVAFKPELFDLIMPYLALNRQGLVIFTHPTTDDALRDHRDCGIWMGRVRPLDLSIF